MPPNPPVEQYWSVTAYDRQTHALIRNMPRASRASQIPDLQKNADGSIDLYFAPTAPSGYEKNWIKTISGQGFRIPCVASDRTLVDSVDDSSDGEVSAPGRLADSEPVPQDLRVFTAL